MKKVNINRIFFQGLPCNSVQGITRTKALRL